MRSKVFGLFDFMNKNARSGRVHASYSGRIHLELVYTYVGTAYDKHGRM